MNSTDCRDVYEAADSIRATALSLGRTLAHLAAQADAPVSDQLMTCAAACEALTDRAVMVADIVAHPPIDSVSQ